MASLERRLRQLEIHADMLRREDEEAVHREILRRLTDEELERFDRALERALRKDSSRRIGPS